MQVGKIKFAPSKTSIYIDYSDCPNCKRLKELLVTASILLDSYANTLGYGIAYKRLVKNLKKEGVK
jgi:hypothetical protein